MATLAGTALTAVLATAPGVAALGAEEPTVEVTAFATPGTGASDVDADGLADGLERRLAALPDEARVATVVTLADGDPDATLAAIQAEVGPFEVAHTYHAVPGFAAELTRAQIAALAALPIDLRIDEDAPVRATTDRARRDTGVDTVLQDLGLDGDAAGDGPRTYGPDDIVIAVIDSGIDADHVDLDGGKVLAAHNLVSPTPGCPAPPPPGVAFDDYGHGTHVASIAAGDGDSGPATRGIAPGAALVSVKVLGCDGVGSLSDVNAGIDWVLQHREVYGIDVLNLSLGSSAPGDGTDATSRRLNQAVAAGLAVFQSAGNAGPATRTVGGQATAKFPIVVGAVADLGVRGTTVPRPGWSLASFSSRGPTLDGRMKPDLVAPGVAIVAAAAGTGHGHATMSGTSMATPFAAGVAALLLQADPTLAPSGTACPAGVLTGDCRDGVIDATMRDGVRDVLTRSAIDLGPAGPDSDFGVGRLDALAAVRAAVTARHPSAVVPPAPATPPQGFVQGHVAPGAPVSVPLEVTSTHWPLAVTFVQPNWAGPSGPDLELRLVGPAGVVQASTGAVSRQETVGIWPAQTGTFHLEIWSRTGTDTWWAHVSGATTPAAGAPAGVGTSGPQAGVGTSPGTAPADGRFVAVVPARALDTREAGGPLGPGETRTLAVAGPSGAVPAVPAGATAVALNLTGTAPSAPTYLTAWASGRARPTASNLNLVPGQTAPNLVIAGLGADGAIQLYNDAGRTDAVVDVVGFFLPPVPGEAHGAALGGRLHPIVPERALDTRAAGDAPLSHGETRTLGLAGRHGVPRDATAVVVNLTGTEPTAATYLTAWPSGAARPMASNLNLVPGHTAPNLVIAGLGPDGAIHLYNDAGLVHAVVDVVGYFTAAPGDDAGGLTPLVPTRALDTRSSGGAFGPNEVRTLLLAGRYGVPDHARAVVVNLTGTQPSAATYLTAWPSGAARPTASNLNLVPGQTAPNLVIAGLGPDGAIQLYNDGGAAHAVVDVVGWFA